MLTFFGLRLMYIGCIDKPTVQCGAGIGGTVVSYGAVERTRQKIRGILRSTVGSRYSHTVQSAYGVGHSRLL